MAYLLDTNACIQILNSSESPVTQRLLTVPQKNIFLCAVVYSELCYGAFKSSRVTENLKHLDGLFDEFEVLPFNKAAAKVSGQVRANLISVGTPIGSNDLLIASVALANELTLVTHNIREFSRIEGLQYEDWEE
jgi:tRNA(fMet)-specific endonuclease VapC